MTAYPATLLEEQIRLVFESWGLEAEQTDACCRGMLYADLRGIDTHGIAMLPSYAALARDKKLKPQAKPKITASFGAIALLDADHGFGHPASEMAMHWAVKAAKTTGIAAVSVRNSNHFGAAGYYAHLAAEQGMAGFAMSGTPGRTVVPPLSRDPRFGALPFAFAAPSKAGAPMVVDVAISTVAMGKINLARLAGKPIPEGWAVDLEGRPLTDAAEAFKLKRLTPMAGHKGYGLGVMVETLASLASVSNVGGADLKTGKRGDTLDIGHFFVAFNPDALEACQLGEACDDFADYLHSATPIDPANPVLVPGDPERQTMTRRLEEGIPLLPRLVDEIRTVAEESGARFVLT